MKRLIYALIVFAFVSCKSNESKNPEGAAADTLKSEGTTKMDEMKATYTCPMHPEVVSDKPGQCPQCGMDLEIKS